MEEIWKDIKGYEGHYQISNFGRVKSLARIRFKKSKPYNISIPEKILSPGPCGNRAKTRYKLVNLYKNGQKTMKKVHQLVAVHFIPNPENKPHINHKDADRGNNCICNLEWCTTKENAIHAYNIGSQKRGEKRSDSKLTEKDVIYIRESYRIKIKTPMKLAHELNVSCSCIWNVLYRKSWTHI